MEGFPKSRGVKDVAHVLDPASGAPSFGPGAAVLTWSLHAACTRLDPTSGCRIARPRAHEGTSTGLDCMWGRLRPGQALRCTWHVLQGTRVGTTHTCSGWQIRPAQVLCAKQQLDRAPQCAGSRRAGGARARPHPAHPAQGPARRHACCRGRGRGLPRALGRGAGEAAAGRQRALPPP